MRTRTVLILGLTAMLALASMMVLIMTTALDKHSVIRSSNMFRKQQDNQPKKLRKQDDSSKKETKNHHHISEADTDMLLAPTSLQACAIFQRHKDIRCGADQPLKICGNTSKFPGVPQSLQEIYNTMDISSRRCSPGTLRAFVGLRRSGTMFLHFLLVQSMFQMQSEQWQHDRAKGFPDHASLQDPATFNLNSTAARRYVHSLLKWAGWVSPLEKIEYGAKKQQLSSEEITTTSILFRSGQESRFVELHPIATIDNLERSHPTGDWLRLVNESLPGLVYCDGERCEKRCEDWRLAVLIRDPRDVLVSQFLTERGPIDQFDFDKKECGVWLGSVKKAECETYSVKQQLRNIMESYRAAYIIERFTSFRRMGMSPSVVRQKISDLQSQILERGHDGVRMPTIEQLESSVPPCLTMQLVRYEDLIPSAADGGVHSPSDGLCALTRTLGFLGLCTSNLTAVDNALSLAEPSVLIRNVGNMRHGFGATMVPTNANQSHKYLGLPKVTDEQRREMDDMIARELPDDLGYRR